jgi:hypothetical protein
MTIARLLPVLVWTIYFSSLPAAMLLLPEALRKVISP